MNRQTHWLAGVAAALMAAAPLVAGGMAQPAQRPVAQNPPGATPSTATDFLHPAIRLVRVPAAGLSTPTAIAARPGDPEALYVAQQNGLVMRIVPGQVGAARSAPKPTTVLDLTKQTTGAGEQGLLGLAFDTDGTHLYVDFTGTDDGATRVVEYQMRGEVAVGPRLLLTVGQPYANHNGGQLVWGPDELLWIALGDGGLANDPAENGQDKDTLLGSILRIDPRPSTGRPYTIPADNPTLGSRPEIWLYGVRNPWRFSFDRENGDLWVADVGQNLWEEIDWLPAASGAGKGANLGWNRREGAHPFANGKDSADEPGDMIDPVYDYAHGSAGCSVTGGFVYRGAQIPALVGTYVYGDFCATGLRALRPNSDGTVTPIDLGTSIASVSTFGQDSDGELYVASLNGELYRIAAR